MFYTKTQKEGGGLSKSCFSVSPVYFPTVAESTRGGALQVNGCVRYLGYLWHLSQKVTNDGGVSPNVLRARCPSLSLCPAVPLFPTGIQGRSAEDHHGRQHQEEEKRPVLLAGRAEGALHPLSSRDVPGAIVGACIRHRACVICH